MNFLESAEIVGRFTDTAIFNNGKTFFTDNAMSFFAAVDSQIPSENEIGVYENISNLLRVASLFDAPEIEMQNEAIFIKETADGRTGKAKFVTSDVRLIRNLQTVDIEKTVQQTTSVEPTMRLQIDRSIISRIKTGLSAIPNSKLVIKSVNGEIEFIIKDIDVLMSTSNMYKFGVNGESTKDCCITLDANFLTKMPGAHELKLAFSEKASTFRAILEDENLTVVIPTAHTTL